MGKLIKYGLLLLLGYFAYTEGPQYVEKITDLGSGLNRKGSSVGQGGCIPAAEAASQTFGSGLRDFSAPPIDIHAWDQFLESVKQYQYDAESECSCPRHSCQKASEALVELSALISDFDNSLRGEGIPLNPARQQETIDRLLKRAREIDRQGN